MNLAAQWLKAKEKEREAVAVRREIEDKLVSAFAIKANEEGTEYCEEGIYTIKVTKRFDRKIDAEKLQEVAAEHGLSEHLAALFRWKPEIAMTAWRAADAAITTPLLAAITTKPGRPSFAVAKKEEK